MSHRFQRFDLVSFPFMEHLPTPPVTFIRARCNRRRDEEGRELLLVSGQFHSYDEVEAYVDVLRKDLDDVLLTAKREYARPVDKHRRGKRSGREL